MSKVAQARGRVVTIDPGVSEEGEEVPRVRKKAPASSRKREASFQLQLEAPVSTKKMKRAGSQNDESSPQEATPPERARYEDDRKVKAQAEESSPPLQSTRINRKALSEAAKRVLLAPPSKSSGETHKWQQLFVDVELDEMPENDKMNFQQELFISEEVAEKGLHYADVFVKSFPVQNGRKYTEENDRPRVVALAAGCSAFVRPEEVEVQTGPVRYIQTVVVDGEKQQVDTSPPGFETSIIYENNDKTLEHGDGSRKSWKMDMIFFSKVAGSKDRTPRIHVEAKGDGASELDLYQASQSGNNLLLKRLQDGEDIEERLYLEVWGTSMYTYGILDVFGYITVDKGVVTKESFRRYSKRLHARSELRGFPGDSLRRLPNTLAAFQSDYDQKAAAFHSKYRCHLPSRSGIQDFPVGVLYVSPERAMLPTGRMFNNRSMSRCFIQSHIRVLRSNSAVIGDNVNEKLLDAFEKFDKEKPQQRAPPAPIVREIFKFGSRSKK